MGAKERIAGTDRTEPLLVLAQGTFICLLIFSVIILASVPPVSKDALIHHLTVPNLYLKHGGIYEIPFMVFSYYPMNLELLYLIPLYFGNDIIPKFIHFSFALLTAWLIFDYLRRRTDRIYALLGVIFFLSVPIIVKLSITVYVDLGTIFFSTASLLSMLRWIETRFQLKFLIISALFSGLAMGTKYNGLITFFLLALFVSFVYSSFGPEKKAGFYISIGQGLIFSLTALLVFSPWMIRDYLWTNNPVFPLFDSLFNPGHGTSYESMGLFTVRSLMYHESWWQIALLPVRVFFQGQDGNPQYFDGKLNWALFVLPFFAFYKCRRDPQILMSEKRILITYAILFFSFAFFSSGLRIRYISPIIPPLVILSVLGIKKISEALKDLSGPIYEKIGGSVILLIIFFTLWPNATYIIMQYRYVKPFDYLRGTVSRDQYIEGFRREFPAMRYINDNLPPDARILFIFLGNRGYFCDRQYVFDMNRNNKSALRQLVLKSHEPKEVLSGLKEMGVTHLLMNHNIFKKWVKTNFDQENKVLLFKFIEKYTKLIYVKWEYSLFCLKNLSS